MARARRSGSGRRPDGHGRRRRADVGAAIRPQHHDRGCSELRPRAVPNLGNVTISLRHGQSPRDAKIRRPPLPHLRQAGAASVSAVLLCALRANRSRPMAQGKLPHSDRGSPGRQRRRVPEGSGIVVDGSPVGPRPWLTSMRRGGNIERATAGRPLWGNLR